MKVKYVMIIYAFVFCILLGIGLNTRLSYKDFNDEKEPLDNFVVGLMDKKMVESGIEMMSENLDKSNISLMISRIFASQRHSSFNPAVSTTFRF